MLEHASRSDALLGIQDERLHEEIDTIGAHRSEPHLVPILAADGVLRGDRVAGEFGDAGPVLLGGGSDGFADELDLVEVDGAGEVRGSHDELGEDGADGPDVDSAAIVLGVEEELRRAVPAGDDLRGHDLMGIREAPCETEISKLDLAVGGNQQVVWLDIAMQHKVLMAEPHGPRQHAHPRLDVCGTVRDTIGVADEHLQVAEGQIFEDEIEVLVL